MGVSCPVTLFERYAVRLQPTRVEVAPGGQVSASRFRGTARLNQPSNINTVAIQYWTARPVRPSRRRHVASLAALLDVFPRMRLRLIFLSKLRAAAVPRIHSGEKPHDEQWAVSIPPTLVPSIEPISNPSRVGKEGLSRQTLYPYGTVSKYENSSDRSTASSAQARLDLAPDRRRNIFNRSACVDQPHPLRLGSGKRAIASLDTF